MQLFLHLIYKTRFFDSMTARMSPTLADVAAIYSQQPNLNQRDVEKISEWAKAQPHLPEITELQAILFLHSCCYDPEETRATIENYFTLRSSSDMFQSGDEELVRRTLATFFIGVFPKKTPEGYVILFCNVVDPAVEKFVCLDVYKLVVMIVCLYFHKTGPANGLMVLCDFTNITFGHLFRLNVRGTRQVLQFLQESAPTKIKGIQYVNVAPVTQHFKMFVKPFMKKEVYDSIQLHPDSFESLYEWIPRDCLPEEYGGELGPLERIYENNLQWILENFDFFQSHDRQVVDETKRIRKGGFFGNIGKFFR